MFENNIISCWKRVIRLPHSRKVTVRHNRTLTDLGDSPINQGAAEEVPQIRHPREAGAPPPTSKVSQSDGLFWQGEANESPDVTSSRQEEGCASSLPPG